MRNCGTGARARRCAVAGKAATQGPRRMSPSDRVPGDSGGWRIERYRAHGLRPSPTRRPNPAGPKDVASVLDQWLAERPDAPALVGRHGRLTFAELDRAINAAAGVFRTWGIGPGDRVAATIANHNELVIAFLATQRLGAIWVGINRAYAPPEKSYLLEDSGASLYLADPESAQAVSAPGLRRIVEVTAGVSGSAWEAAVASHAGAARPALPIDPWAPAAIAYTSGTTGFPKGVVHSQHNMIVTASVNVEYSGDGVPETVRGTAMPLTILNVMILGPVAALSTGAVHVNMDRIDALGVAEWIVREQVSNMSLVPTVVRDLFLRPDIDQQDLRSLSWLVVGGSTVPPELPQIFEQRFGRRMTIGYGLTEGPNGIAKTGPDSPILPGLIGRPLPHLRMAILGPDGRELPPGEEGEIAFRESVDGRWAGVYTPPLGYWNRPEETDVLLAGGWVHSGDVGVCDEYGDFHIRDRRSDLIVRGGANVYPAEVERVIRMVDRVRDCAVLGLPDERLGQIVAAFVEPTTSGAPGDGLIEELRDFCLANLAAYKVPVTWQLVEALPRNAMGKVMKTQLAHAIAKKG